MSLPEDRGIIKPARGTELGWRKARGRYVPFSKALGVGPYFSNLILSRINKQKPCNVIWTGEAGISKSYSAIAYAVIVIFNRLSLLNKLL